MLHHLREGERYFRAVVKIKDQLRDMELQFPARSKEDAIRRVIAEIMDGDPSSPYAKIVSCALLLDDPNKKPLLTETLRGTDRFVPYRRNR